MTELANYNAKSGRLVPVWVIEIQTLQEDTDRILDAVMEVHPLKYGRYQRTAAISAVGKETMQPEAGSTTTTHIAGFQAGGTENRPMVELKISVEQDIRELEKVMGAILHVHHYEEPVIFIRDGWASRSNYNPDNSNPNRWWNNGRGLPDQVS